jgi:hypothetical protein
LTKTSGQCSPPPRASSRGAHAIDLWHAKTLDRRLGIGRWVSFRDCARIALTPEFGTLHWEGASLSPVELRGVEIVFQAAKQVTLRWKEEGHPLLQLLVNVTQAIDHAPITRPLIDGVEPRNAVCLFLCGDRAACVSIATDLRVPPYSFRESATPDLATARR